jgi:hypothetical protein
MYEGWETFTDGVSSQLRIINVTSRKVYCRAKVDRNVAVAGCISVPHTILKLVNVVSGPAMSCSP